MCKEILNKIDSRLTRNYGSQKAAGWNNQNVERQVSQEILYLVKKKLMYYKTYILQKNKVEIKLFPDKIGENFSLADLC